jgi:hypothetical protein
MLKKSVMFSIPPEKIDTVMNCMSVTINAADFTYDQVLYSATLSVGCWDFIRETIVI